MRRADGSIGGEQARLIDFDNPDANDWLVVSQYTVMNKTNRRPQVVISSTTGARRETIRVRRIHVAEALSYRRIQPGR